MVNGDRAGVEVDVCWSIDLRKMDAKMRIESQMEFEIKMMLKSIRSGRLELRLKKERVLGAIMEIIYAVLIFM